MRPTDRLNPGWAALSAGAQLLTAGRAMLSTLILSSLVLPTALQGPKLLVLGILVVLAFLSGLYGGYRLAGGLYALSACIAAFGLVWTLYGQLLGNPGATRVTTVMVAYPLMLPLAFCFYTEHDQRHLVRLFLTAAFVVSVLNLVMLGSYFAYPDNLLYRAMVALYEDSVNIGDDPDALKFRTPNVASVIFLLPFFLALLLSGSRELIRRRWVVGLAVLLMLPVAVFSGRRALLLTMFLAPLLAWLAVPLPRRRADGRLTLIQFSALLSIATAAFYAAVQAVGADYFLRMLESFFDFTENASNLERRFQFDALIQGFFERPFWGHGAGAAASYIRSIDTPWAYELFYVALLFQYGVAGALVYGSAVGLAIVFFLRRVYLEGRGGFYFCYFSGMVAFLIASATNPYLSKFDYMWVIFVPYALMNARAVRREGRFL